MKMTPEINNKILQKVMIISCTAILYCCAFVFLHTHFGSRVAALAVIPTIIIGFSFGMWGGILAGVLSFISHLPLYVLIGENVLPDFIKNYTGATFVEQISVLAIGAVVGRMRDLRLQAKQTLTELETTKLLLQSKNEEMGKRVNDRTKELEEYNEKLSRECDQRRDIENSLRYRFKLEELITNISTDFIKLPFDELDDGIQNALESIGVFIDVDKIYCFLIYANGTRMDMAYEWAKNGTQPIIEQFKGRDVKEFSWLMDKMNRLEPIYISDTSDFPPPSSAEREIFMPEKIQSCLTVPVVYGEQLKGFLCFVSIHSEEKWVPEDIGLLQTLGNVFINALEHKKSEETRVAERLKTEFLTNITHEFRTPLTLAMGPLETILIDKNPAQNPLITEQLHISLRNIKKLLGLVDQLLDFSSLEAGAPFVSYQKRDLQDFVSAIVDFFSPIAARKNIKTVFKKNNGDFTAYIDPEKMDKVIINVIGNAYKFTPEGGMIEIGCQVVMPPPQQTENGKRCGHIDIFVKDNGIGIKKNELGKVFDRFYRGNNTSSMSIGGTGLGLSLAKSLIELQGGCIKAESIVGKGSTFMISVPRGKSHINNENLIRSEKAVHEIPHDILHYAESMEPEEKEEHIVHQDKNNLILVVDDNHDMRRYIKNILMPDYQVLTARDGIAALGMLKKYSPALIISDIMMPNMNGYELCKQIKTSPEYSHIPFIFLTAKTDMEMKLSCLENGADEYIVKPFNSLELKTRVQSILKNRELLLENIEKDDRISLLAHQLEGKYYYQNIVTQSKAMHKVFQVMSSLKNAGHPVLVRGETGTGKELIARSLHFISPRKENPFIVRNCSAFSEQLLESEVFGHVKGSFTGAIKDRQGLFELAHGGTLFLDEIGDMSMNTQAKLLRVLEYGTFYPLGGVAEKNVDIRVIAATNKDLGRMVNEGTFRKDLFYRLNVFNIFLPPLRERKEDIPLLVEYFLDELSKKHGKRKYVSSQALSSLMSYFYPGNIRELKNIIEKSFFLSATKTIKPRDLPQEVLDKKRDYPLHPDTSNPFTESARSFKKQMIIEALMHAGKNKTRAAEILNITRPTLYKQLRDYGIKVDAL